VSAIDCMLPRLMTEEGFRALVYRDTEGHETIGYGFNISAGISKGAATALLQAQVSELHASLLLLPWYAALDEPRQGVCLDIAFNGGLHGLLGFPHMIAALQSQDWPMAASECAVTNAELAGRYRVLARILLTGVNA
jgi:lysozyme